MNSSHRTNLLVYVSVTFLTRTSAQALPIISQTL